MAVVPSLDGLVGSSGLLLASNQWVLGKELIHPAPKKPCPSLIASVVAEDGRVQFNPSVTSAI